VAIGASCAFLTPIGHQSNTLVMGPGGYRFRDYWPVGVPVELIVVAVSAVAIPLAWPF
jgi:di/tricarboxylate transporter